MKNEALIGELLAHLIISDEHIHSDQIAMLKEFIELYELDDYQSDIFEVLEGKKEGTLGELYAKLSALDKGAQQILLQNTAAIIGFNRHFAKEELAAINELCEGTGFDKSQYIGAIKDVIAAATRARNEKVNEVEQAESLGTVSLKVRRFFSRGSKREFLTTQIKENELMGPDYGSAIKKTGEIAEVDCQLVESKLDSTLETLNETRSQLREIIKQRDSEENQTDDAKAFRNFMNELTKELDEQAQRSVNELKDIVDKKRRAKNAFTIALMGRTKAGKSTLHYVMSGEGREFIGIGSERTTRFNRVYEWENLKLIDTPGVGAAEAGGRTDEEIALSVVDTADVICYVVTTDSVQEVEFEFLSKIRDNNKPVFILLNCKENLQSPPPSYKKFIKNPLNWYLRKDDQSLAGTISRIERGVESYYDGGSVTVIPVQLMAAKMAMDEKYTDDKETLKQGSRIQSFFNEIRENVIELGKLRKSQTLLDNTACRLQKMRTLVSDKGDKALALSSDIEKKRAKVLVTLKKQTEKSKKAFLSGMKTKLEFERANALDFATDNYKENKKQIQERWKVEAERIDSELSAEFTRHLDEAGQVVKDAVAEAIEDIEVGLESLSSGSFDTYETFNTRRVTSVFGALVGTAGAITLLATSATNPIGWALVGGGMLIGLLSGLLTSKEDKKRNAINKIMDKANETLKNLKEAYQDKADKVFADFEQSSEAAITRILSGVAEQFASTAEVLARYRNTLDDASGFLNQQFAMRIIEFARGESLLEGTSQADLPKVTRQFGKHIEIETDLNLSAEAIGKVEKALKEKIVVTAQGS